MVNSIDALKESRRIDKTLIVNEYIKRGNYFLEITDNGIPIEEDRRDKIFEEGYSSKVSEQSVGDGGTKGLGLGIARDIIMQEFGGRIILAKPQNQFKTFLISIPLRYAAENITGRR